VFLELIRKLKARIYELEFCLSAKRVIGLIGTEKSCPMIVEINSNSIDGQTRPSIFPLAYEQNGNATLAYPPSAKRPGAAGNFIFHVDPAHTSTVRMHHASSDCS